MTYVKLPVLDESGYAIVDSYDQNADPREWENLVYVDWKSSGDTRFAPLAKHRAPRSKTKSRKIRNTLKQVVIMHW